MNAPTPQPEPIELTATVHGATVTLTTNQDDGRANLITESARSAAMLAAALPLIVAVQHDDEPAEPVTVTVTHRPPRPWSRPTF